MMCNVLEIALVALGQKLTGWKNWRRRTTMDKIMQLVLDIMQLAIEISKNTKTDVFVSYSGHVDSLDIMVYYGGWSEDRDPDYIKSVYLNPKYQTVEYIIETLEEIYAELVDLKWCLDLWKY